MENKIAEVHERHLLIAKSLSTTLETYHRDLITVVDAFADEIAAGKGDAGRAIFDNLYFRHVCIADKTTGAIRVSYLAEQFTCPDSVPPERLEMFHTLAKGADVGMSGIVAPQGEQPRIFLVKDIGDELVVAAVKTDFFQNLQERISFGQAGHAAIFDHEGHAMAHPLEDWDGRSRDFSNLAPVQQMMAGESGVVTFFSPVLNVEMIAGFATVQNAGWGVMVPQPISELEEMASTFNRDAMLILFVGMGLSLVMALGFSFQMSRRMGYVQDVVQKVSDEDVELPHRPESSWIGIRELLSLEDGVKRLANRISDARKLNKNYNKELEDRNRALKQEISERQAAEMGRSESENRFRNLFEYVPMAIREEDLSAVKSLIDAVGISDAGEFSSYLVQNPDFVKKCGSAIKVIDVNRAAMKLLGFKNKEDMRNRVTRELKPASLNFLRQTIEAIHSNQTSFSQELVIYSQNDEAHNVIATWSVMSGHEDTYARILLTTVDITERLKAEESLSQAQKMEAVGQLTGGIAHDFNNLLTVIGGNAELLDAIENVDRSLTVPIQNAVKRGAELTQRLLAYSRKQPLTPSSIDLANLVHGMTKLLEITLGAGIQLKIEHEPDLWLAHADPGQVENALLNLALNARDAMPNGGTLVIRIDNERIEAQQDNDLSEGDYLRLSVEDDGMGMSAESASQAFEPFFSTKEVGKGSGLGLSMVYGFAKQSGGNVTIESKVSRGTNVTLYLPRSEQSQTRPENIPKYSLSPKGQGEKILVLEDDHEVREYIVKLLHALGYTTLQAPDACTAKDVLFAHNDIDLIISDVRLPGGVSGPEFAKEIRPKFPKLNVIFVSGYPPQDIQHETKGVSDAVFLTKPFDTKKLSSLILQSLRK